MKVLTMDENEKVELKRKAISRAVEFEAFDRPLSGFVFLELFLASFSVAFTAIILFEEFVIGGFEKPGLTEWIWALICGIGLFALLVGLMQNSIVKVIVLMGFSLFWTTAIVLGAHNIGLGIAGLIGAGILGFAISTFFHFVGFEALNE